MAVACLITCSGLSAPSSLAEGFEPENNKNIAPFPNCASGSAGRLRVQIYMVSGSPGDIDDALMR
jgi:hypothetical protein